MARGNWSQYGAKAQARCRLCARAVGKKEMVRLNGINPAHKACADAAGRSYTQELVPLSEQRAQAQKGQA